MIIIFCTEKQKNIAIKLTATLLFWEKQQQFKAVIKLIVFMLKPFFMCL